MLRPFPSTPLPYHGINLPGQKTPDPFQNPPTRPTLCQQLVGYFWGQPLQKIKHGFFFDMRGVLFDQLHQFLAFHTI